MYAQPNPATSSNWPASQPTLRAVPPAPQREVFASLPPELATLIGKLAPGKRRVRQGETLFRSGTPFHNLYVVRAGMFKSIVLDPDGREQVTGFQMTGDMLGLDGIASEVCQSNAIASLSSGNAETASRSRRSASAGSGRAPLKVRRPLPRPPYSDRSVRSAVSTPSLSVAATALRPVWMF